MKYTVEKGDLGITIKGDVPLSDLDALISTWEGMEGGEEMVVSHEAASLLNVAIAIAWNSQDLIKWVTKLRTETAHRRPPVVGVVAEATNDD